MTPTSWPNIIYLLLVLALMFPTLIYLFRQNNAMRNILIWLALITGLVVGYNYYHTGHLPGQAVPQTETAPADSQAPSDSGPVREL
jgi:predicted aspartyl protease